VNGADAVERAPFPCCSLCIACGFITPPGPPPPERAACPYCRQYAWVDLASDAAADALTELDAYERPARASSRSRLLRRTAAVLGSGLAGAVVVFVGATWMVAGLLDPFMFGLTVIVAVGTLFLVGGAISSTFHRTRSKRRPARWSLLARPGFADAPPIRDVTLQPTGELLVAPLTGRPCLAYEVGIRHDGDANGAPGTWLLLEQRSAPVIAGAHVLGPDALGFAARRERVQHDAFREDALRRYLRERGLSPADDYQLFEAVLLPGTVVAAAEIRGTPFMFVHAGPVRRPTPPPRAHVPAQGNNPYCPPRARPPLGARGPSRAMLG
jgi:hypothetical protein